MNHQDHVHLIENGIEPGSGGVWADFGAGTGAFTLALRDVAGPETEIYAIDRDASSLQSLRTALERQFPGTSLQLLPGDFTQSLALPPLDGILAANAIHFVRDQVTLLRRWRGYLKPEGRFVLVEYDSDSGNRWVPHPVSFRSLARLAQEAGFGEPRRLETVPSRFLGGMYAAAMLPRSPQSANPD